MNKFLGLGLGVLAAGGAVLFAIVVALAIFVLSVLNQEVALRNQIQAKSTANEAVMDTMWKTIKQKAGITEQAVKSTKELNQVYEDLVQGREGGTLFKMVTENYPNLGQADVVALYKELMVSVEFERKVFLREQTSLVDLVRERKTMIDKPISGLVLSWFGDNTPFYIKGRVPYDSHPEEYTYMFVTSKKTKQMVDEGEENDIELFDKEAWNQVERHDQYFHGLRMIENRRLCMFWETYDLTQECIATNPQGLLIYELR